MDSTKRLLVFTDPGLDDAMALIFLLKYLPSKSRVDIFCVGGNNSAYVSYQNTCSLLNNINKANIFIWKTDSVPQQYDSLVNVHGSSFLGLPFTDYYNTKAYPNDWQGVPESCDILVLAACTIPLLLSVEEKFVNEIIVMGGCEVQPNYNGLEFNQAMDVSAFYDFIKKYQNKAKIITIDSCRNALFDIYTSNYREYLAERSVEYKCFNLYEKYAIERGSKICIPYDLIAAFALLHKERILYKKRTLLGIEEIKPFCMTETDLRDSSEFWDIIWEKKEYVSADEFHN